jgi:hypothetical protein
MPWNDLNWLTNTLEWSEPTFVMECSDSRASWNDLNRLTSLLEWSAVLQDVKAAEQDHKQQRAQHSACVCHTDTGPSEPVKRERGWVRLRGYDVEMCCLNEQCVCISCPSIRMWIKLSQDLKSVKLLSSSKHNPSIRKARIIILHVVCRGISWFTVIY